MHMALARLPKQNYSVCTVRYCCRSHIVGDQQNFTRHNETMHIGIIQYSLVEKAKSWHCIYFGCGGQGSD